MCSMKNISTYQVSSLMSSSGPPFFPSRDAWAFNRNTSEYNFNTNDHCSEVALVKNANDESLGSAISSEYKTQYKLKLNYDVSSSTLTL